VSAELLGWDRLRHGGLLLDAERLRAVSSNSPPSLDDYYERNLRKQVTTLLDESAEIPDFVSFVLENVCGFTPGLGKWERGSQISTDWSRKAITGESIRPRQLWHGPNGAILPVFHDSEKRLGIGRGRKSISSVLQWLRAGKEHLALLTNGRQWRLIFAGLDFDAWCEWDVELWMEEGALSSQVHALRTLISPALWTPPAADVPSPLLSAILDSRKGQGDLSASLGERVREAVELLVQAHGDVMKEKCADVDPADIYRAAVRMVMRMVVVLFAESRDLLPRENTLYHGAYGLTGLLEELEKVAARGGNLLARSYNAWPRALALFRLVHDGSHHAELPVPAYGGNFFAPGDTSSTDGLRRALAVFENACFEHEVLPDRDLHRILERITRTRVKLRQGRSFITVPVPVDFADLSTEYIGILYEGLLDFELRTAPPGDPVIFLAVGHQPALPLSRLEAMDDRALANLLEKMKDTSKKSDEGEESGEEEEPADEEEAAEENGDELIEEDDTVVDEAAELEAEQEDGTGDNRHITRTRAETWARRAVAVGKLVKKPKGAMTPDKTRAYEDSISQKARQLVVRVILPGEWYLVRWGGTRKGSGTFYTKPPLAVPTVHRTLRPLAYDPPLDKDGNPNPNAPAADWTPKKPEEILALKVCDPACGSGTFPISALRFLTDALYAALHHHKRFTDRGDHVVIRLLASDSPEAGMPERLADELLPARLDDPNFEMRLKAILRRHVVERCIYGVDLDPLAVELCRLAIWIETMDRTLPFSFLDHKIKCGNALVGAWFDQFEHYPAMAWNREGGDTNHKNGVHFKEAEWTKAIGAQSKIVCKDLKDFIDGGVLHYPVDLTTVRSGHDAAVNALRAIHELGIAEMELRGERYAALIADPHFVRLKEAFDLWCALWFWPADMLEAAPLPLEFAKGDISEETRAISRKVAENLKFFHWELEFPDVFHTTGQGFNAVLGNPPWETLQPTSKEFFSAIDPMYRSYGKQEALSKQREFFGAYEEIERKWLSYTAFYKAMGNWLACAGFPFGDRVTHDAKKQPWHDFDLGQRGKSRFAISERRHTRWKQKREETNGYADADHIFRHQGSGKVYTYKMFVEQAHGLLRDGGRMGLIVPSGVYSDHGTRALRKLFLEHCTWEWIFGFENRDGIFDIHRSFKFNPVIVQKGGTTQVIRTAFMRRNLADWEHGEDFATDYPRERVVQFSPKSLAILEIQSERDLEVLTKIYSNSVLLGDQGPDGWGIKYAQGDFNMTSDSHLFPPRTKWEEWGYQPDEYSRWIKGPWQSIEELWAKLGVDPAEPVPIDPECAERIAEGIANGEVAKTDYALRCAQPPYDRIPIPRADIPEGIILNRDATQFIREDEIPIVTFTEANGKPLKIKVVNEDGDTEESEVKGPAVMLPLYQGVMIWQLNSCTSDYIKGATHSARWEKRSTYSPLLPEPQFGMGRSVASCINSSATSVRIGYRAVQNATNQRTMICSLLPGAPAGNSFGVLYVQNTVDLAIPVFMCDFAYDFALRPRMSQANLNWFILEETPVPPRNRILEICQRLLRLAFGLTMVTPVFAMAWLRLSLRDSERQWRLLWSATESERTRLRSICDAVSLAIRGIRVEDLMRMIKDCDHPLEKIQNKKFTTTLYVKDFWREDKDKHPECRHTILSLVALHDLLNEIAAAGGDLEKGIEAFCTQNDGEGWMLPETLRLADYGLGHDDRAKEHQPVRACFGPRFYDWQLAQPPEESWRECHLHARTLLGAEGYQKLLDELSGKSAPAEPPVRAAGKARQNLDGRQLYMEAMDDLPLFAQTDAEPEA